ncbi:MAG: hypothetical protein JJU06_20415 [Ectothiorhodospiraceae bacterium]|nr:hypothetical protein [Ectothiorhodospiraceae bacterium]MCH8505706.1 hypothetical protein [Ectothiorhodospiraceae bacterium]
MTQMQWLYMIIVGELALIALLVLGLLSYRLVSKGRKDRAAARQLVERVKNGEVDRRQWLRATLEERYGLADEDLERKTDELLGAERRFYEHFIDIYVQRDADEASNLSQPVQALLKRYTEMPAAAAQEDAPEVPTAPGAEATPTRSAQELAADVALYRRTLNRVFNEYTAMFGVQLDNERELTAREILDRLESGQLAGPEDS